MIASSKRGLWRAKKKCCEDLSNVEGYDIAVADKERVYHLHHRNELDKDGNFQYYAEDLIRMGLYWNRPASELIFLTREEHTRIHKNHLGRSQEEYDNMVSRVRRDTKRGSDSPSWKGDNVCPQALVLRAKKALLDGTGTIEDLENARQKLREHTRAKRRLKNEDNR